MNDFMTKMFSDALLDGKKHKTYVQSTVQGEDMKLALEGSLTRHLLNGPGMACLRQEILKWEAVVHDIAHVATAKATDHLYHACVEEM